MGEMWGRINLFTLLPDHIPREGSDREGEERIAIQTHLWFVVIMVVVVVMVVQRRRLEYVCCSFQLALDSNAGS